MKYIIHHHDGPARLGTYRNELYHFDTPNTIYYETQDWRSPPYANLIFTLQKINTQQSIIHIIQKSSSKQPLASIEYPFLIPPLPSVITQKRPTDELLKTNNITIIASIANLTKDDIDKEKLIVLLPYSTQLLHHSSSFLDTLTQLRAILPPYQLLYIPAIATPGNMALLNYIGIDLFDNGQAVQAAVNSNLLFPEGTYPLTTLKENPCTCPSCFSTPIPKMTTQDIFTHNTHMIHTEQIHIANAIRQGRLRELVEIRVRGYPHYAALLHLLDMNHFSFLEKYTPLYRTNGIQATTSDALWRPEVHRFQNRIINRCKKPPSAKILLLLPCSAKKPYSRSKTHTLIRSQLRNLSNPWVIHEMIITSPLGLVPRELENIYPASSYDISVSGFWSQDERTIIQKLLKNWIEHNTYDTIVVHVNESLQHIVEGMHPDMHISCVDAPTSQRSLEELFTYLQKASMSYPKVQIGQRLLDQIFMVASYQFGHNIAKELLYNCVIKGRAPQLKIIKNSTQLGMITIPRGLISLTLEGAQILIDQRKFWVKVDKSFTVKGSIFVPGVIDADPEIRIGDEVCIIQNDEIKGVGLAVMPGLEMISGRYGEAVKLRHHTDS
ncbi:MAG: DUF5591 domain-containing protein [Candidatus Thermoplasmatota archaeon]|nr:DUF5591 domain-containing protein [Candidatus Thermoplasmatota archaeon]MBU1941765.1 DUF5591 domain-containing protein [Candidatus Thermoplasmatota archaeon]